MQQDKLLTTVREMVTQELSGTSFHTDVEKFKQEVGIRIFEGSKVVILIEAPSSRAQILHELIDVLDKRILPGDFAIWIPVLNRWDIMQPIMDKLARKFPDRVAFVVQISSATQTKHTRPQFALHVPFSADPGNQTTSLSYISKNGCRAFSHEHVRQTCNSGKQCKHRPKTVSNPDDDDATPANDDEVPIGDKAICDDHLFAFEEPPPPTSSFNLNLCFYFNVFNKLNTHVFH